MDTAIDVTVVVFHALFSLVMIMFILLHRGTGGGLSDMFGGGSNLSGSAIVERNLDRLTVFSAVGFAITTVLLGLRFA